MVLYVLSLNTCKAFKWTSTIDRQTGLVPRRDIWAVMRLEQGTYVVTGQCGKRWELLDKQNKMRRGPNRIMEYTIF